MRLLPRSLGLMIATASLAFGVARAHAQDEPAAESQTEPEPPSEAAQPSVPAPTPIDPQQRRAAAEAYDRGTTAYLAHEYARAADWFETANRLAPNAAALAQAIRAHERAGNTLRAGTLALRLLSQYPDDHTATRAAENTLRQARPAFVHVTVECTECTIDLDGTLQTSPEFFVEPNADHHVILHFGTGSIEQTVSGGAGENVSVTAQAPPAPPTPPNDVTHPPGPATTTVAAPHPPRLEPPPRTHPPLGVAVTVAAMVVTAGLVGVTVWSGVDTLSGVDAYRAHPTQQGLDTGQGKELRTDILIGASIGVGVLTLVAALFLTDWHPQHEARATEPPVASVSVSRGGASAALTFRF